MDDLREKVIKGLECCRRGFCFSCPYNDGVDENVECKQRWADDAISLLKAQEQKTAYWVPGKGKSHIFYCSHCAEKVNYNNAHRVYNKNMKPIEQVNKFCRGCGYKMVPWPTDEQREAVKWE